MRIGRLLDRFRARKRVHKALSDSHDIDETGEIAENHTLFKQVVVSPDLCAERNKLIDGKACGPFDWIYILAATT